MALALLDLVDFDEGGYDLAVDTGTNTQYEIRLGDEVGRRAGLDVVDGVFQSLPLRRAEGAGDPLAPPETVRITLPPRDGALFAQLYTSKPGKRSPAISAVVELPRLGPGRRRTRPGTGPARGLSLEVSAMNAPANLSVRAIRYRDAAPVTALSFDTILAEVIRIAQPIVAEVLKSAGGAAGGSSSGGLGGLLGGLGGVSAGGGGTGGIGGAGEIIQGLLKAFLAAAPAPAGGAPVVQAKSLPENRFSAAQSAAYATPMFLPALIPLIGAAIGPLIQILPQLANAANQRDKDRRAAQDAMTSGILKDINQRLLMDQVLEAQRLAAANPGEGGPSAEDLAKLAALVSQLPAAPATAPAPVAVVKSLSLAPQGPVAKPSARAVLEPVAPAPLVWYGGSDPLFARSGRIALRYRFVVAAPVPANPLAKAILKVTLADEANPALRFEKSVRLIGVLPGSEIECPFEPGELVHLPSGSRLIATAALRWPGQSGATEALGSMPLVLVGPLFVKARGNEVGAERELTDMQRWRQFWNKVWEAPSLDRESDGGKRRWKLDADIRYAVVLGSDPRNGVMETRFKAAKADPDNDYAMTQGRLKGGIELTVPQLSALRGLWDMPELPSEHVAALGDAAFLARTGGEAVRRIDMKGRSGERGLVWMIPTFRLVDVQLSRVKDRGVAGDVVAVEDETVQLPLPVALRVLAMKSN